jgi:beta-glucosidase/6-phospho-beta-glucosidase/beta-galactosidase
MCQYSSKDYKSVIFDGFELNEKLKETLVSEFKAKLAISRTFNNGVPIIPEPFLETNIIWDKDIDDKTLSKALTIIMLAKLDIDKVCHMTNPQLEITNGRPIQIIWSIFNN